MFLENSDVQLFNRYVSDDCHFHELKKFILNISKSGKDFDVIADIFKIWLLEKIKTQVDNKFDKALLKQSTNELALLTPMDIKSYLMQGVIKGDWRMSKDELVKRHQLKLKDSWVERYLDVAMINVIVLCHRSENTLMQYCELLNAVLNFEVKLENID